MKWRVIAMSLNIIIELLSEMIVATVIISLSIYNIIVTDTRYFIVFREAYIYIYITYCAETPLNGICHWDENQGTSTSAATMFHTIASGGGDKQPRMLL